MDDVTANLLPTPKEKSSNNCLVATRRLLGVRSPAEGGRAGAGRVEGGRVGGAQWGAREGAGEDSVIRLMVAFLRLTLQETFYKSGRFRN